MILRHTRSRCRILARGCAAIIPFLLGGVGSLEAAPPVTYPPAQQVASSAEEESAAPVSEAELPCIQLNYYSAPWSKVLQDLADATEKTLVADRMPRDRFNRRDRTFHSEIEAIRILNHELEKKGFRLIVKGQHLVLLEIPTLRSDYERPVVTPQQPTLRHSIAPKDIAVQSAAPIPTHEETLDPAQPRQRVRQANAAAVDRDAATGSAGELEDSLVDVSLSQHSAVAMARLIYEAFKPRAELIDYGPQGLPAFRVFKPEPAKDAARRPRPAVALPDEDSIQFSVGIDQERNQLVVQAPAETAKLVADMIEAVDLKPQRPRQSVRLIASSRNVVQVAARLQPALNELADDAGAQPGNPQVDPGEAENRRRNRIQLNPQNGQQPAPREGEPRQPAAELLRGGLKGDVSIESVPDLNIMILRGKPEDVDAVMELIREIERFSVDVVPDVELLHLQHVSGEALAGLLRTVYSQLTAGRGSTALVTIIPLGRPNALLIVAAPNDIDAIVRLASELDQPIAPGREFQVFPLKHAVPANVVQQIAELYPSAQDQANQDGTDLMPRVKVTADMRTNSVIVQASPRDLKEIAALIRKIDIGTSSSVNQMRIFPLKHALAEELAQTLMIAIQSVTSPPQMAGRVGGGLGGPAGQGLGQGAPANVGGAGLPGGAQTQLDIKSTVLQFLAIDGNRESVIRSGILTDIRVTANARTNSLVVTAPEQSMELMAALIKQLDRPTTTVAEIKVFTLANGDAAAMAQLLDTLFASQNQRDPTGVAVVGSDDASSNLIPLRFSVDTRTNSIIAIGGADALRVVEAVLLRLDQSDIRQRQSTVYRLKNSPALDVATAVNQFLTSRRQQVEQAAPGLLSPFEQIEREVVVVPEPISNSLLISATPRYFEEIRDLVVKLDEPPSQVIIQALLVEVTLDNTDEFGLELGFQDSILFDRSVIDNLVTTTQTSTAPNGVQTTSQVIQSQTATPGFLFNNQQLGNNTAIHPSRVGSQGLSNFAVGRVNDQLGFGGLVLSASSESISVLLRALAAKQRVDILSRPQIRTLDNQLAQIQVGQQVPIVDGVNVTAVGSANPVVRQDQAGIILTVTPRVSPDDLVVMEVIAEKSQFTGQGVPIFTDATSGNVIESPIKDITTARTVVSVRNGQTIVLGGMITKTDDVVNRKVPWLGDLPLIGNAFRYDFERSRRTELLIFLTPRVIHNDGEAEWIKQVEMDRLHFIEQQAEQMHGPLRAIPAPEMAPGEFIDVCPPGTVMPIDPGLNPELFPVPNPQLPPTPGHPGMAPPGMLPNAPVIVPPPEGPPPGAAANGYAPTEVSYVDPNSSAIQQMSYERYAPAATAAKPGVARLEPPAKRKSRLRDWISGSKRSQ